VILLCSTVSHRGRQGWSRMKRQRAFLPDDDRFVLSSPFFFLPRHNVGPSSPRVQWDTQLRPPFFPSGGRDLRRVASLSVLRWPAEGMRRSTEIYQRFFFLTATPYCRKARLDLPPCRSARLAFPLNRITAAHSLPPLRREVSQATPVTSSYVKPGFYLCLARTRRLFPFLSSPEGCQLRGPDRFIETLAARRR